VVTQIIQIRQSLLHHPPPPHDPVFIPALLLVFIILLIDTCLNFFSAWKQSILDVERFKAQVTEAQLHALKNQLNPHFLFNNLSVLSSLVYQNQDKAVSFISELAKVYRYVLENNKKELVLLEEELAFISHYVFLLKIRFANSFNCRIHVDENLLSRYIPPMSLQVLVENAIQHNESSISKPLTVNIYSRGNSLTIENNIQPRIEIQETTKFGLMNIQSRYFYTTEEKIQVLHDQYVHKVILPLIVKK
jgi:LytS/YehU family sensor histidine kinase